MKDVMNGSATLNVVTSGICVSRSGLLQRVHDLAAEGVGEAER